MKLTVFVLVACVTQVCVSSPARRNLKIPEVPGEINGLTSTQPSTLITPTVNIEDTIKEVEDLIKGNPSLPRLTRGEILDIIENITKTDIANINKSKTRDQKAVMLVMPYSPDNAQNGDYQSLYTKPPVTHMINDTPKKEDGQTKKPFQYTSRPSKIKMPGQKVRQRSTSTTSTTTSTTTTRAPFVIKETSEEDIIVTTSPASTRRATRPSTTRKTTIVLPFRPLRRRTTTKPATFSKYPNHKYPDEIVFTSTARSTTEYTTRKPIVTSTNRPQINQGLNIVPAPNMQAMSNTRIPVYYKPSATSTKKLMAQQTSTQPTIIQYTVPHRKEIPSIITSESPMPLLPENMPLPEDFKDVLKNLDVLLKQDPTYTNYQPIITTEKKQHAIDSENNKNNVIPEQVYHSSTTSLPEFQQVASNLSPDMKDLLMSFGLIPDPNKKEVLHQKIPTVKQDQPAFVMSPDSYTRFKPLPEIDSANADEDLNALLVKYGLGTKPNYRAQKAITKTKTTNDLNKETNLDTIPDDLKSVLKDIGITYKDIKAAENSKLTKPEKMHVFNPLTPQGATEDDLSRLNQVVGVIKQLEKLNGSVTDEDLKHIDLNGLKELVGSLNVPLDAQKAPNPLDYDKGILKNEVKRQQSTTSTTAPIDEPKNPSLADLEASFGGPSADSASTTEATTTTTEAPRRTGFYYLVDWNSFFDIDNQEGKRVNLRFQPTIGDPKRFYAVTVP